MSEIINIELKVTGAGAEKSLDSVTTSTKNLNKETKDLSNSINNSNKGMGGVAGAGASAIAAYAAVAAAMAGVIKYGKESIDVFLVQEDASDMVSDAFGNYASVINDAADATQKLTKIGNEQYQALAVQAKNFGVSNNEVNKSVQDAIALADLYGSAGANEEQMLEALIDAQNGKTKGLEKYVKELRGVTDEEERSRILNEKIAKGWEQASTAGATFGDQIAMIKNSYGDLQEIIGQQILSGLFSPEEGGKVIDTINTVIEVLEDTEFIAKYLGNMREQAEMIMKPFMNLLSMFGEGVDTVDAITKAFEIWMKVIEVVRLPITRLWAGLDALTGLIADGVALIKDWKNVNFQDVLNIINEALYKLIKPFTDVIGLTDDLANMLGIDLPASAGEAGTSMVDMTNMVLDGFKKASKEGQVLVDVVDGLFKKVEEAKKAQEEENEKEAEAAKKRTEANKKAAGEYETYLKALYNAKEESRLLTAQGEDLLEIRAKELASIYSATKAYYALYGYTEAEIQELVKLQDELTGANDAIVHQQNVLEEMSKVVEENNPFEAMATAQSETNAKILKEEQEHNAKMAAEKEKAALEAETKKKEAAQKEIDDQRFIVDSIANIVQTSMDAELKFAEGNEKKQKAIKKRYALGQAALSLSQIAINTAEGITKATAQTGILAPVAIPLVIAQGIASALAVTAQTANIMKMKRGGVLSGPSHSAGGIKAGGVEFEGNEGVINKNTMSNPALANLVSYANMMGGGVPLTNNTTSIIDYDLLASKINDKKVYVVSSDVTTQQKTDNKVVVRAQI